MAGINLEKISENFSLYSFIIGISCTGIYSTDSRMFGML